MQLLAVVMARSFHVGSGRCFSALILHRSRWRCWLHGWRAVSGDGIARGEFPGPDASGPVRIALRRRTNGPPLFGVSVWCRAAGNLHGPAAVEKFPAAQVDKKSSDIRAASLRT